MGFSAFSGGGRFEALLRTGPGREETVGAGTKRLDQLSCGVGFSFFVFLNLKIEPWDHGNKGSASSVFF